MPYATYCSACDEVYGRKIMGCSKCQGTNQVFKIEYDKKMIAILIAHIVTISVFSILWLGASFGSLFGYLSVMAPLAVAILGLPTFILHLGLLLYFDFKHRKSVARKYVDEHPSEFKVKNKGGKKRMKPDYLED